MIYFAFKQLGHEQKGGAESGEERPPLAPPCRERARASSGAGKRVHGNPRKKGSGCPLACPIGATYSAPAA